jgi:hypothetical protein
MNNQDYIPRNEEDFNEWQDNFMAVLATLLAMFGIPAAVFTTLQGFQSAWVSRYAVGREEADPTSAQRQAKRDARKAYVPQIRQIVKQYIQFNPATTNDVRISLGLTVADTTKTPAPVPDRAPKINVDKITHAMHKLRMTDPDNPDTKKKPKGVRATRVFRFIGTSAPAGINQYSLIGNPSRFLFNSAFDEADAGKRAWYIAQYENTRGETGPLSDAVSAVIA